MCSAWLSGEQIKRLFRCASASATRVLGHTAFAWHWLRRQSVADSNNADCARHAWRSEWQRYKCWSATHNFPLRDNATFLSLHYRPQVFQEPRVTLVFCTLALFLLCYSLCDPVHTIVSLWTCSCQVYGRVWLSVIHPTITCVCSYAIVCVADFSPGRHLRFIITISNAHLSLSTADCDMC